MFLSSDDVPDKYIVSKDFQKTQQLSMIFLLMYMQIVFTTKLCFENKYKKCWVFFRK